jgi:hypothetical protein
MADALDVRAHDADDGALLPDAQERLEAVLLDNALDPVDLFLRRRRTHHHDHSMYRALPLRFPGPSFSGNKKRRSFRFLRLRARCLRRRDLLACFVPASRKTTAVTSVREH